MDVRERQGGEWEGLQFVLVLDPSAVTDDLMRKVEGLIESWFHIGFHGGFGSPGHFHSFQGFVVQPGETETRLLWIVDMGSADEEPSITTLVTCLEDLEEGFVSTRHVAGPRLMVALEIGGELDPCWEERWEEEARGSGE